MRVEFINLRQVGLEPYQALARLAARHWQQGQRVLILAQDQHQAQEVDRLLWTHDPQSFLPHALAGGSSDESEPILVATQSANRNQAQVLIALAPCEPDASHLGDYQTIIDFVPAEEGPSLDAARQRYRLWQGTPGVELLHTTSLPA